MSCWGLRDGISETGLMMLNHHAAPKWPARRLVSLSKCPASKCACFEAAVALLTRLCVSPHADTPLLLSGSEVAHKYQ